MARFGIEEEFVLLDRDGLAPVSLGPQARDALPDDGFAGTLSTEFLTCQIEYATSPVDDLGSARDELNAFRRSLASFAADHGSVAAGVGTPFGTGEAATVSPSARYRTIADWLAHIVGGHQVNGVHVHTEIPEVEDRIRALNGLRPWLPVLLAISGNAPFWHGQDSGYRSWRTVLLRRLPTMGCPPVFHDETEYRDTVERLIRMGVAPDAASVSWAARISERFPTVEVRVFDAQLSTDDTLFVAALTRALLTSPDAAGIGIQTDAVDAALWIAAREGLDATLIHPFTGEVADARTLARLLLRVVTPALQSAGDLAFVTDRLERALTEGTGADRQLRAFETGGIEGLRTLLGANEPVAA